MAGIDRGGWDMNTRPDWEAIIGLIPAGTRVLELGCGDGALMARFLARKAIYARGVERDENNVRACVAAGLSVRHGDIEKGLADYSNQAFEYVILSQTLGCLQHPLPVLREMLRVARFGIVSFENAGYWRDRIRAIAGGGAGHPLQSGLPLTRSITLPQFLTVLPQMGLVVDRSQYITGNKLIRFWPSMRARTAIFMVTAERVEAGWSAQQS